jgi:hypothetical protein
LVTQEYVDGLMERSHLAIGSSQAGTVGGVVQGLSETNGRGLGVSANAQLKEYAFGQDAGCFVSIGNEALVKPWRQRALGIERSITGGGFVERTSCHPRKWESRCGRRIIGRRDGVWLTHEGGHGEAAGPS